MAENSNIEWTDHTFNPWRGCQHATLPDGTAHPGCDHCYAEALAKRNPATLGVWGAEGRRVVAAEPYWGLPEKWNAAAEREGVRRRVFCASLSDVFEEWGGQCTMTDGRAAILQRSTGQFIGCNLRGGSDAVRLDDVRRRLFALIDATPWLDWLILTKRPENVRRMWPVPGASRMALNVKAGHGGHYRPNVWLLTSVSDQASADATVPALLACRDLVPVLGLSVEPLVGPVDLGPPERWSACSVRSGINWIIVGGESGPNARPCDIAWVRSIVAQCEVAGVPVFVKQLGAITVDSAFAEKDGTPSLLLGIKDKKGGNCNEWPADLRVRQFPEVC